MSFLAIIPARAGSIRAPHKNVEMVGGLPLVAIAIRAAQRCAFVDEICVTTDDPAVAAIAGAYGVALIDRPPDLSTAEAEMLPVVRHTVDDYLARERRFAATILLQPTSPLRTSADIDACAALFAERDADSVVSVVEASEDLAFQVRHARRLERVPQVVFPNGAVYVLSVSAMMQGVDWYSGHAYAYHMPKDRSLDVDTPFDLQIARLALERQAAV